MVKTFLTLAGPRLGIVLKTDLIIVNKNSRHLLRKSLESAGQVYLLAGWLVGNLRTKLNSLQTFPVAQITVDLNVFVFKTYFIQFFII